MEAKTYDYVDEHIYLIIILYSQLHMRLSAKRVWGTKLFTSECKGRIMERTHEPSYMTLVLKIQKIDFYVFKSKSFY